MSLIVALSRSSRPRVLQQATLRLSASSSTRHASSSTSSNPPSNRLRNFTYGSSLLALVTFGYVYFTDTRASVHRYVVPPLLRALYPDAEDAHHAGTAALKQLYAFGWHPRERGGPDADGMLNVEVFGHMLSNPIGISAGLDKNADIPDPLFALGPGIVEVGGITNLPQDGNPKPRVFRVTSQKALINRYGLNSEGADVVAMRLRQRLREFAYKHGYGIDEEAERFVLDGEAGVPPGSLIPGRLLAVQIAKNKLTPDDDLDAVVRDHVVCVEKLGRYADILVVNVSSPNTPGLRSLQSREPLTKILSAVVNAANSVNRQRKPVVMVKVSPDEDSEEQVHGICDAVWESGVAGVIVGNTTMKRPDALPRGFTLPSTEVRVLMERGGYSGPQLFGQTVALVRKYRQTLDQGPRVDAPTESQGETAKSPAREEFKPKVIFASGGITNGEQALAVLNAGASAAMCYTATVYGGPGTVGRIKGEMREAIKRS
ncbi:FMN-linked oxidoreductase [Trichodelitschia bisporula]|uniref:Dihydroorotate dehydrogenase (quinone), mitochondrial n=1 Tax=Trichodelitschia bisporula TaxID=703511 RepID=A0A6G1IA49_9PEZI|nr:FMN-linked oxidoreductase [Trichodelitschia bisporula]